MYRRNQKIKILKSLSKQTKWIVWDDMNDDDIRVPAWTIVNIQSINKENNTLDVSVGLNFKATKEHSSWGTRVDITFPIDSPLISKV